MNKIKKALLIATALTGSALSAQAFADGVEVYLLDRIDGVLNHYCIDTNGPPHDMQVDTPLQTHTCYSYKGELTADQAMDADDIAAGKIRIVSVDLCAQIDGTEPGATVTLTDCADVDEQRFELRNNGQFASTQHPGLCLTAGPSSAFGGSVDAPTQNQHRTLRLQPCSDEARRYQSWGTRTSMSAEAANKKIALDFYRPGITIEERDAMIHPDYIQHNPAAARFARIEGITAKQAFPLWMERIAAGQGEGRTEPEGPRPPQGKQAYMAIAEGDKVFLMHQRFAQDPNEPPGTFYEYFSWGTFGFKDGLIYEHWDGNTIARESDSQ